MMPSSPIPWSCGSRGERAVLHFLVRVVIVYALAKRLLRRIMIGNFDREFPPVRLTVGGDSECLFTSTLICLLSNNLCDCFVVHVLLVSLRSGYHSPPSVLVLGITIHGTVRLNHWSYICKCTWIVKLRGDSISSKLAQVSRGFHIRLSSIRNWLLRLLSWWGSSWSSRIGSLKVHCIVALTKYVLDAALLQCSITGLNDILRTKWLLTSRLDCVDVKVALCFVHLKPGCCSLRVLHVNLVDITL